MRRVEEIKAEMKRAEDAGHIGDALRLNRELMAAEKDIAAWWNALPIERKGAICVAERESRCVILPSRQDEIVHAINVALHVELYDWQIAYIFGASDYRMPGRRTGKTLAYVLRLLLSEGDLVNMCDWSVAEKICDEDHGQQYVDWFRNYFRDIYYELSNPGFRLKLRKVRFTRDKVEALPEVKK